MKNILAATLAVLAVGISGMAMAAGSTPTPAPGWTGLSKPRDVVLARGNLMETMEILMQPIDTITVQTGLVQNEDLLHRNAEVVAAILTAVPHLFPPTTNLYDPKSEIPATIALPAIWQNFDAFYQLDGAASAAARQMATAHGDRALREASLKLRASCDACHALFLRKYEGPKLQQSDKDFDFDAALGGKKK